MSQSSYNFRRLFASSLTSNSRYQVHFIVRDIQKWLGNNLRFAFRQFPLTGAYLHVLHAAEATEAADAQGMFWEMHDELFAH